MQVSIVGSGYVGTTVAACFADAGHDIVNIDIDDNVVAAINNGHSPIHEPGLDDLVSEYGGTRLRATSDYDTIRETGLTMLALPTPSTDDGSIDLAAMEAGARSVGETLAAKDGYHLVFVKSTVVPGTTEEMHDRFPEIAYADSTTDALAGAHAAVVVTDWDEFAALDEEFDMMARPVVIDGRNIITRREGLTYEGLTW